MCERKRGSLWLGCAVPGGCVVISGRPNSPARENSLGHTKLSQSLRGNPCCASMALGSPVLRFPPHTHTVGHDPCGFCLCWRRRAARCHSTRAALAQPRTASMVGDARTEGNEGRDASLSSGNPASPEEGRDVLQSAVTQQRQRAACPAARERSAFPSMRISFLSTLWNKIPFGSPLRKESKAVKQPGCDCVPNEGCSTAQLKS